MPTRTLGLTPNGSTSTTESLLRPQFEKARYAGAEDTTADAAAETEVERRASKNRRVCVYLVCEGVALSSLIWE